MPGPHAASIAGLIQLDEVDQERLALQGELSEGPKRLEADRGALVDATRARDDLAAKLAALRAASRSDEAELAKIEKIRQRARDRLPNMFVAGQIEATQRETAQLGDLAGEVELRVLERMEEADGVAAQLVMSERTIAAGDAELARLESDWSPRAAEMTARLALLDARRAELLAGIDRRAIQRYEIGFERKRRDGRRAGITFVEGFECPVCLKTVPPKWVNEARQMLEIHACDGCRRVLVFRAPEDDSD